MRRKLLYCRKHGAVSRRIRKAAGGGGRTNVQYATEELKKRGGSGSGPQVFGTFSLSSCIRDVISDSQICALFCQVSVLETDIIMATCKGITKFYICQFRRV